MNPLLPLLLAGGGLGLLALILRGRGQPQTPDPQDAPVILFAGAAGERQFEMRRVGPGYGWNVRGSQEGGGSDTSSGLAIVSMFEFLYEGNSADIVTGHVIDSDKTPVGSFTVTRESATRWAWLVSKPQGQTGSLGSGDNANRGSATIAALNVLAPYTDWITNLPTIVGDGPQGDPLDPNDTDGLNPIDPIDGTPFGQHGLTFGPDTVSVYSLPEWLDYAAPIVRPLVGQGATASEIHDALGLHDLPNTTKFKGKTHGQVLNTMLAYLNQWEQQKYLEVEPIERTVAAAAVGAVIPSVTGNRKGLVKGKPVVVKRAPNGVYEWFVWPVGNRRGVEFAMFAGSEFRSYTAWNKGVNAAAGPDTVEGGGAPVQNCDTTIYNYSSPSFNTPSRDFQTSWEKTIKIWQYSSQAECRVFTIDVGLCMIPAGGGSFGSLDYYVDGLSEGDVPSVGDAAEIDFGIARHPAYDAPMDWWRFEKPLAWKRQVRLVVVREDGQLSIDSVEQGDFDVDACPDVTGRWPGQGDDHYVIQTWKKAAPRDELTPKNWRGRPELTFVIDGNKVNAHIKYTGLPFLQPGTAPSLFKTFGATPNKKNSYTIGFKIRYQGEQ
jgi:hypothetical protein